MKTDLGKYYPPIYKNVLETDRLVEGENKAFAILDRETKRVEKNQYILTSDELGIEIWRGHCIYSTIQKKIHWNFERREF